MNSGTKGATPLSSGVCKASATFTGTNGIHEFQFRSGFCQAVHIYLHKRETDWGWGTLEFQTTPFRGGIALQTSITPTDWPILSGEL